MARPYADFRWVDDIQNFDFTIIALDSATGYVLHVDKEYPQHLHNAHTNLLFRRERNQVSAMTSSSQHYSINSVTSYIIVTYTSVVSRFLYH